NVFNTALALCEKILNEDIESGRTIAGISKVTAESIAVTALFHDLCKINMYFPDEKFTKEGIKWVRHLKWGIEDKLPIGHAEKSLYFASKLISLMPDEVMAIRWHMGMYDIGEKGSFLRNSFYTASDECPLVTILHCADTYVSKCMETTYDLTQYTL
ncbi:MAG: hypothetical protein HUK07_05140, partial [Bacteroidaceae bacterium]|nr:hypothetical protein [Bacteroidaceae bacterium]